MSAAIIAACACVLWNLAGIASGQLFYWDRSGQTQTQTTTAAVSVTVNGGQTTPDPEVDTTTTGELVGSTLSPGDSDASLGGGGGDGGSGARMAANGDNGANGGNFTSVDGDDGPDFFTTGGAGGNAGTDGGADVDGQTVGELEFSPDDQELLSWSFIHNQNANMDLAGGGGGGAGGKGQNNGAFVGGTGGSGGNGESATGAVNATQTSTVNVTSVLRRVPMSSATPTNGRFTVDIGWTCSGTWPAATPWNRGGTIVMSHSDGAILTIIGPGGNAPMTAEGTIPGNMCPFAASSNADLDDVTGELVIDIDDFVFPVTLDSTATIRANGTSGTAAVFSVIAQATQTATGGGGGTGMGTDGADGGNGLGASGGAGGSGYGSGGDGGDGGAYGAHEDGIYQGLISVWVDLPS